MSHVTERVAALPSGVTICFDTFGSPDDPTVLLVMGLGGPMGWWDEEFCRRLSARGFQVVRFDNRDTGRSTTFSDHHVGRSDVVRAYFRLAKGPYTLGDMAQDALGLLNHLGIAGAHLVGMAMGGMIAQTLAIAHPDRVLSLTSIMSTTGRRRVGWQQARILPRLLRTADPTRESYVAHSLRRRGTIGSPAFPTDEAIARARAEETYDRGWTSEGVTRQMMAVLTQPDRTKQLASLDVPATVIHGRADPLVHPSGGRATAAAIPGAELVSIAGLGHDLPVPLYDAFIDAIVHTAARATRP